MKKLEAWKYTRLPEDFMEKIVSPLVGADLCVRPALEGDGLKIRKLKDLNPQEQDLYLNNNFGFELNPKEHPLACLNKSELGYLIEIPDNLIIKKHLEILIQTGVSRVFIKLGKNSELNILEKLDLNNNFYSSHLTFCEIGEGARLNYLKLVGELESDLNNLCEVSGLHVRQLENSVFNPCVFGLNLKNNKNYKNNSKSRFDLNIDLMGPGASCEILGGYYLKAKNHFDWHTVVNHKASHTKSNILAKGLLDDYSTGVFYAKAQADAGVLDIEAHQKNQNILLSDFASIYTQPVLNIYTSGISCTHGATVGELDPAAVFYLQSRGIAESEAREMLIHGFLNSVILEIKNQEWRDLLI